jgi:hypothetical protein
VAERRALAALAAVVRFAAEPTWLGLEWTDGAPAAMYILPQRDALAAALLDAAQVRVFSPRRGQHVKKKTLYACRSATRSRPRCWTRRRLGIF